ncbi:MAG: alpha/beta hydrolase [Bacteroidales bacterium]|nr:alpha/beta hydrolase [Bacteroidales bacterium]
MDRNYSDFCDSAADWKEEYVPLATGVELHTVVFTPPCTPDSPVILFIPGLISIIENFRETVIELTRNHKVIYVETREKGTARIGEDHRLTVKDITDDIVHFAEQKIAEEADYIMVGYSLGATVIAEAFSLLRHKPLSVILIQPNSSFPFKGIAIFFARLAKYIYRPVIPFVKWYMRTFMIDIKSDDEMYRINCRNLDTADPARLGAVVRQLSTYRMDGCLEQILVPALVVVASKDRFHSHGEGTGIASLIPGAQCIDMEDNKRTHGPEMGRVIGDFISSLAQIPSQADQL